MSRPALPLVGAVAAAVAVAALPAFAASGSGLAYPAAPRADVVDTYFGTPVPDPYRPLERVEAPETQAWLRAQNGLTRSYLDALPYRDRIRALFARLPATSARETPLVRHGQFWSSTRSAGGTRPVISVRDGALQPDRVLLDENALPPTMSVAYVDWSRSGRLMAYATESGGSDWLTWHVRDVLTATDLPDVVRWGKYVDCAFAGDEGFYYSGYDAPAPGHEHDGSPTGFYKAFYHRLGTPQSDDLLIAAGRSDQEFPATAVTPDGRYAMLLTGPLDDAGYDVFPAENPRAARRTVIPPGGGRTWYAGNDGPRFFFRSYKDAPNGRIVEADAGAAHPVAHTLVAERGDPLVDAQRVRDRLVLAYLHDVHSVLEIVDERGRPSGAVTLPGIGTATIAADDDAFGDGTFDYTFQSFTQPPRTFRYDLATGTSTLVAEDSTRFDGSPYVTDQLFATSKDGTRVPLFVVHRRDLAYDGSSPTLLYGYGGFGETFMLTPTFTWTAGLWLQMGGTFAVVNARGGGELGEAWHRAGMLTGKQHVFDDVVAAAQELQARRITSPAKLAVMGSSGGGLMVAAVATQRPDLFAAAMPIAAPTDMLRFQRFNAGASWASETGSSDQSEAMFRALYAYSPLHNVRAGTRYPAMLIRTGQNDDRVFPAHSYKFAAALQAAQAGDAPILLDARPDSGHDFGVAGTAAERGTDWYAFVAHALGFVPNAPP